MPVTDTFFLSIDRDKFRSTNAIWNELRLNDPWSVGYVSDLIAKKSFLTKEEWEQFYYDSGHERYKQLLKLSLQTRNLLNNFMLKKQNPAKIKTISPNLIKLNTFYGRTKNDLMLKAKVLCKEINYSLSLEECFTCVRFRTICETWNGIVIVEKNTIKNLQTRFPEIIFCKVDGERDYKYAIDYELFYNGKLLGAIQIKPKSYSGNAPYIKRAKKANERKHQKYNKDFCKNVRFIIADKNGNILNDDDFIPRMTQYYRQHLKRT